MNHYRYEITYTGIHIVEVSATSKGIADAKIAQIAMQNSQTLKVKDLLECKITPKLAHVRKTAT